MTSGADIAGGAGGGGGGTAAKAGGGEGELLLEHEEDGPETGARVEVIIFRNDANPPKFAFRFRLICGVCC